MPFQYISNYNSTPLIETDPGLRQLMDSLVQKFQGPAPTPQYPNSARAFNALRTAAQNRHGVAMDRNRQAIDERAAAGGKTLSSAHLGKLSDAEALGSAELENILAGVGEREQGLLTRQAEGTADAQARMLDLASRFNAAMGGIQTRSAEGGAPSYQQQRNDYLQDLLRQRQWMKEDMQPKGPTAWERFLRSRPAPTAPGGPDQGVLAALAEAMKPRMPAYNMNNPMSRWTSPWDQYNMNRLDWEMMQPRGDLYAQLRAAGIGSLGDILASAAS